MRKFCGDYLERFPNDRTIPHTKFSAPLSGDDLSRRYPQIVVVENADDVAILSITRALNIGY